MRRFFGAVGLVLVLGIGSAGLLSSSATAETCAVTFCVTATNKVNGSTGGVTVAYHSYPQDYGSVKYSCYLGPLPLACDVYFTQSFAWYPFGLPTFVAGNPIHVKAYTYGTSVVTGQSAWNYNDQGQIAGTYSLHITGQAYADTRTGTGTYYNGTGTGKGHMVDENYINRVTVK